MDNKKFKEIRIPKIVGVNAPVPSAFDQVFHTNIIIITYSQQNR